MELGKYSFGIGDRFAHEGQALLSAIMQMQSNGVQITPVWNKSYREHQIIDTIPQSVRDEADAAVKALKWQDPYFVDADHININIVDEFLHSSDFFTIDVADYTGRAASDADVDLFIKNFSRYTGNLKIEGINRQLSITETNLIEIARKYLLAVKEAGKIYRRIEAERGKGNFITEVSMDETDAPQTPEELFFILAAVSMEGIPADTIAPKFSGRFNKGVDYVGDIGVFTREFREDLCVIKKAVVEFGLPSELKLSIHSGSDKFSIYKPMRDAVMEMDTGLHVKTAGTTWLEEIIGLALSGEKGLNLAKKVYRSAYNRYDELCQPYASVIDINMDDLPLPDTVDGFNGDVFASTLRHEQSNPMYNLHFRQLLHVGYKIAAEMGEDFYSALRDNRNIIAENVSANIFERHLSRVFM